MSAESASGDVEIIFQRCLNDAITMGLRPARNAGLGSATCDAIELVAMDHPEAQARVIADAFDAFALEHGALRGRSEPLPPDEPARRVTRTKGIAARTSRFRVT